MIQCRIVGLLSLLFVFAVSAETLEITFAKSILPMADPLHLQKQKTTLEISDAAIADYNASRRQLFNVLHETLSQKGAEGFADQRSALVQALLQTLPANDAFFWARKLDQEFLREYLKKIASSWLSLSPENPLRKLAEGLNTAALSENLKMNWMQSFTYPGTSHEISRGRTWVLDQRMEFEILSPTALAPVLAHELTHLMDTDLKELHEGLHRARESLMTLATKAPFEWTPAQQDVFGRYWFLKNIYPKAKEFMPKLNACLAVLDLTERQQKIDPNDQKRFQNVLKKEINCAQFSVQELITELGPLDFFWAPGSFEYKLTQNYFTHWIRRSLPAGQFLLSQDLKLLLQF